MFQVLLHDPKPLIWWYEQFQRGKINLEPTYQRKPNLWIARKQGGLIDSIINDYDMPKIYVADFTYANTRLNEEQTSYAVIDGKQRLLAIFKFFDDELALNPDFRYEEHPNLELANQTYAQLKLEHPRVALKVENHIPAVMSVIADKRGKIEELFIRLNTGIPVNGAEKRNAMAGIVPVLIRDLAMHRFFTTKIRFSTLRMQDHNVIAKLLLIEYRQRFVDTKASNLDRFVREAQQESEVGFVASAKRVRRILNQLVHIFEDRDDLLSTTGQIPIYYWLVREHPDAAPQLLPFLRRFALELRENFEIMKEDPDRANPVLSNYYTMSRTTNDQASLFGRYRILEQRLLGSHVRVRTRPR